MNNGRIGDVFEYISRGKSPQYVDQSSVHVINQACIRWDGIDFSKVKYQNPTTIKKDAILNVGDLLISSTGTGTLGRCCVFDGGDESITYVADSHVTVIRKSDIVLPSFAKYYLMHDATQRELYAQCVNGSTNQIELSKEKFKKFLIPVPSKEVQQSIVIILEKIEELIALRKEQLAKLDQLVKSRFIELFGDCLTNPKGWKTKRLEDIAEVGSSKRVFVEELKETGIPFYRGTEVGALAEGKPIKPELFITEEHYSELCEATGTPRIGDLLMPSICPDGRIWVVNSDEPFYFKDGRVLWVHNIDASYNSIFLLYTLKDRIMTDYSSIASGTTFAELKIFALKKCRIFDVPLAMQNEFAAFVEQTDKSKLAIQQSLDKLELLKKSLMQEYFG